MYTRRHTPKNYHPETGSTIQVNAPDVPKQVKLKMVGGLFG
jgi:hypothetical protein